MNRLLLVLQRAAGISLVALLFALPVIAQEAPLGTTLPQLDRSIQNVDGASTTLGALRGSNATVIVFWSNQCPWVDRYEDRILALASRYRDQGVNFILVNPNDPSAFPQESAQEGRARAQTANYGRIPYVVDQGSQLANALGATRTPHVYVFDGNSSLVYVGGVDDSPTDAGNVGASYLDDALSAVVAGRSVGVSQTRAFGCTIKFYQ
jgi:thiol-disulfide isomerase/thioredoxin